jgi:hypothetical protein
MIRVKNRRLSKEEVKKIHQILFIDDVDFAFNFNKSKEARERLKDYFSIEVIKGKIKNHTVDIKTSPCRDFRGWRLRKHIKIDGRRVYSKTFYYLIEKIIKLESENP